ncbi:hypothetical protein GW17_00002682 [Ensete ventricosum]|nr:hypothetical protein GW17_00002682 [Ensete ventricosum]
MRHRRSCAVTTRGSPAPARRHRPRVAGPLSPARGERSRRLLYRYRDELGTPVQTGKKFMNLVAGCSIHYWPVQQGGCCFLVPTRWKSVEQVSALLSKLQLVDDRSCISARRTIRLSCIFLWLMGCCNRLRFAPIRCLLLPYHFHRILGFQNQSCAVHTYRSSMMRY